MQYLGVNYSVKNVPELDPGFIPFGVWAEAYLQGAKQPLTIAVERENGNISVRHTFIHGSAEMAEADYRYVERYVKFLLVYRWLPGVCLWLQCHCAAAAEGLQCKR